MWLISFVWNFTSSRSTSLVLPGGESEIFQIGGSVPQGSLFSVILFVFYNTSLLDLC
jgi:hypothetical protein